MAGPWIIGKYAYSALVRDDMTADELKKGEHETVEFKQDISKDKDKYTKTAVAFANAAGGKIIFGVEDSSWAVVGFSDDEVFRKYDTIANSIFDACEPSIVPVMTIEEIEGKKIIVAEIRSGMTKPYYLRKSGMMDGTYVRIAGVTRKAEPYMIKELQLEGTNRSFDSVQVVGEISEKEIKQLCNRLYKHAIDRCKSAEQRAAQKEVSINQLITWKIIVRINEKFYPTNAWKLLTGDTEELFPNAFIQMAAFKGITRSVFLDKQEARGPIDQQIEDAMMFVKRHINLGSRINGKYMEDYYELPIDSIREIISNAVCHRSYLSPGSIQVAIYDDRLEVTSPGRLSPDLTIEQIKEGNSRIRNSAIGAAFFYMHIIENWGSGIPRVFSEARLYGLDEPEIKDFGTSFRITIKRKKFETDPLGVVVPYAEGIVQPQSSASNDAEGIVQPQSSASNDAEGIVQPQSSASNDAEGIVQPQSSASNDAEEKSSDLKVQELITKFTSNLNDKNVERTILILTEIHSNLKISVEQIGKNIKVSRATVQRAINEMKKLGILSRKGSNNGGSWIIHFDK